MSPIPRWIALLLAVLVIGVVWHVGTRDLDFMAPPTATQIEMAKTRASQQLAHPSDLFAVHSDPASATPAPEPPAPEPVEPAPVDYPKIAFGDLSEEPILDAWTELEDIPAASFIDLASRLEAETRMAWARVAWERVIDHSSADEDELQAAIKGILRTQLTPTPHSGETIPKLTITITAPNDRVQLSRRAAADAAEELTKASSGLIQFTSKASSSRELTTELEIGIGAGETISAIRIPAPESPAGYLEATLQAAFRLISSQLAADEALQPVTLPAPGEKSAESLATRITRIAWFSLAKAYASPE